MSKLKEEEELKDKRQGREPPKLPTPPNTEIKESGKLAGPGPWIVAP